MRYLAIAVIVALVFSPAVTSADTKKTLDDHEARIGNLETNDAAQDTDLADHETRITDLEQQTPAAGVKVNDDSGNFLGILMGSAGTEIQTFLPNLKKFLNVGLYDGEVRTTKGTYYSEWGCTGNAFLRASDAITDDIFKNLDGQFSMINTASTPVVFEAQSYSIGGICDDPMFPPINYVGYPVIPVPPGEMPFTDHADVPLHYEY